MIAGPSSIAVRSASGGTSLARARQLRPQAAVVAPVLVAASPTARAPSPTPVAKPYTPATPIIVASSALPDANADTLTKRKLPIEPAPMPSGPSPTPVSDAGEGAPPGYLTPDAPVAGGGPGLLDGATDMAMPYVIVGGVVLAGLAVYLLTRKKAR